MIRLVAAVTLILAAGCSAVIIPTHELRWTPIDTPAKTADISGSTDGLNHGDRLP